MPYICIYANAESGGISTAKNICTINRYVFEIIPCITGIILNTLHLLSHYTHSNIIIITAVL